MPIRICKKCGNKLTNASNYFCNNCGDILEPSLTMSPIIPGKSVVYYDLSEKYSGLKRFFSNSTLPILKLFPLKYLFILIFAVFIVGGYGLYSHNYDYLQRLLGKASPESENTCSGDFVCGNFGDDNLAKLVPYDVSLYVEGFDFIKFSQLILDFDPSLTYIFEAVSVLNPSHFAMFVESSGADMYWTMIIVSSQEPTGDLLNIINNPKNIYIGRLSNTYVISTKGNALGDIQMIESGINKNIGQNSNYIIAKNSYPKGQFLIVSSGKNSQDIIGQIQSNERVPGYLRNLATQFLNKKGNYLVL